MTGLAQRLGAGADRPLLLTPAGRLDVADVAGLGPAAGLAGKTVMLAITEVRDLVRVLAALDGHAAGLLLAGAGQTPEIVARLAETAGATQLITDRADLADHPGARPPMAALGPAQEGDTATTWMMTTSGTTGLPKIVPHTLGSLARTVRRDPLARAPVWGLVYEMTRFAGLQVAFQALLGGGTLAAPDTHAPLAGQVAFLAEAGTSHLSATPTLWRRLLMTPGVERLGLRQATLGGEIADQTVLDAVGARFPEARVTHIYASTEAGVGFPVNDCRAGFPLAYTQNAPGGVGVKLADGQLWLRPPGGHRPRYLGGESITIDADGYVATGDRIEIRGDRALYLGRDSGMVNVGGVKIYPERVERVIASVPGVAIAQITHKKSPITGALLMATVVPSHPEADRDALKSAIMAACRAVLEREAVPARITFAEALKVNAAGKILRT